MWKVYDIKDNFIFIEKNGKLKKINKQNSYFNPSINDNVEILKDNHGEIFIINKNDIYDIIEEEEIIEGVDIKTIIKSFFFNLLNKIGVE